MSQPQEERVSDEHTPSNDEAARVRAAYAKREGLAQRYSVFDAAHLQLLQSREREILRLLRAQGLSDLAALEILDMGCGAGQWLGDLIRWGADPEKLWGIDLGADRIDKARASLPPLRHLEVGDASKLSMDDASFDLVLQGTVFSSILDDAVQDRIAKEMWRVLKPGGRVLWFDFHMDNPRNRDVRGVKRGRIAELFPQGQVKLARTTLIPPLGRAVVQDVKSICAGSRG